MRKSEGGGVIVPNYQDLVDMSENPVSVHFSVDCIEC